MMLRQSTSVVISFGPFLDVGDAATLEIGLVSALDHASTGILLSKNGGALTIRSAAVTATTYDAYGNYRVTLSTTDTDTLGTLRMQFIETATCLPVWQDFMVLPANVWDSLYGSDKLDVNVEEWNATAVPAEHTAGYPIVTVKDGTGTGEINTNAGAVALVDLVTTTTTATNVTTVNGLAAGVITAASIADNAIDTATFAAGTTIPRVTLADTVTTYTGNTPQTGDSFARIGAAGAGLTDLGGFSTTAKGQIQTEAEDAIVVHRLDELLNADSDIDGAAPPTVGSVFHELMTKTAGSFTYDQTTDSLEAIRDRGDAAWITATGFSTHTAADVWAAATRTLTAGTNIQLPSNGLANVTAWTVAITGNITGNLSGSVGSVTGSVGSLAAQAKTDVNAEVVDALATDTYAEPGQGAPAATASLSAKLNYLYKAWRNKKTQTASEFKLYADDAATVDQKATVSDDSTTTTVDEMGTGA